MEASGVTIGKNQYQVAALKTVVCGTDYGLSYARIASKYPDEFDLVGIYARGSERSKAAAAETRTTLYTDIGAVPQDVDVAYVAVSGDAALDVTAASLRRSVNVLAEHPVIAANVRTLKALAETTSGNYHVNAHFSDLSSTRDFTRRYANCAADYGRPMCVFGAAGWRTLYSLIDVLQRCGLSLEGLEHLALTSRARAIVHSFQAVSNTVPLYLQLFAYQNSSDNGRDLLTPHRATAVFRSGSLIPVNAWGPVIWSQAPAASLCDEDTRMWTNWSAEPGPTFGSYVESMRVDADLTAMRRLSTLATGGAEPE